MRVAKLKSYNIIVILKYSTADMCSVWPYCAFYDKSMKFGRQVQYTQRNIFRYRDIADLSYGGNGGHFKKWLPMTTVDDVCISEYVVIVNLVCLFLDRPLYICFRNTLQ